jgi:hypothetical protein
MIAQVAIFAGHKVVGWTDHKYQEQALDPSYYKNTTLSDNVKLGMLSRKKLLFWLTSTLFRLLKVENIQKNGYGI